MRPPNPNCPPIAPLSASHCKQILAKAEFLNPGGSVKDRVALQIVREALAEGRLAAPGGLIAEGTAGSTGISLSLVGVYLVGLVCLMCLLQRGAAVHTETERGEREGG